MPESKMNLVFLSYAHEDLDKVRKVYAGLKNRRVNVWFDKENLKKGRWKPQIMKAISRSRDFVICLSNTALKKMSGEEPGFQDEELQTAWEFAREQDEKKFAIIPVRLEDCGRGDLRLSGWRQYDLFEDWEGVLDTLAVNLGGNSLSDASAIDERTEEEKMIESMMGKGATFWYSGEYDRALSLFEAVISIKPDYNEAWNNKGGALVNLNRPDEALKAFHKAIEIKPDDHVAWYNKGVTLDSSNRPYEALESYNKVLEINPDDHKVLNNKGVALNSLGRPDEALEAFNKALETKPDDHVVLWNKGNAFKSLGRYKEAQEAFNKALEINPDFEKKLKEIINKLIKNPKK